MLARRRYDDVGGQKPGDALSDRQRAWLTWFQQEGVEAGVLRVVAQVHRQTSILDQAEALPI